MGWLDALATLRQQRVPAMLVTVVSTRGHAPRGAGAKLVVTADRTWGTIGGGNLEATAVQRARAALVELAADRPGAGLAAQPRTVEVELSEKAPAEFGRQCCGGEVVVLFEPMLPGPVVVVFGMGHVGQEIARVLSRHELDLVLVDSRPEYADPVSLPELADAPARVSWHHADPPQALVDELPAGAHVLVLTHDHAQDAAVCGAALRRDDLPFLGLIGSSSKWRRIEKQLRSTGLAAADTARVVTPIGDPRIGGKLPAVIALAVAVDLLSRTGLIEASTDPQPMREQP